MYSIYSIFFATYHIVITDDCVAVIDCSKSL